MHFSIELVREKFYVYPDVLYTCSESDKNEQLVIKNPSLVVEVLSDKTEAYDLGTKLDCYLKLPSLLYYVIISQHAYFVRCYQRVEGKWEYVMTEGLHTTLHLSQQDITLPLEEIYEDVVIKPLLSL